MIGLYFRRIILLVCLYCTAGHLASQTDGPKKYKLVWSDEFNSNGPVDPAFWNHEKGFVRNEEHQYYQPSNAWCDNGLLIIEARKESRPNPAYVEGSNDWRKKRQNIEYTSSSIRTMSMHSWQYGRFEMRGRIDISDGIWPAWWTLGVSKSWPANGEIDIMEYYRGRLLANIACMGNNNKAEWFSNTFPVDSLGGKEWSKQFHVWRMDWTKDYIALYIDDHLLNKVSLSLLVNKDGTNFEPFKQPHYMLLNLAIGGQNGGNPENTVFPTRFEVDWVRVYEEDLGRN